MVIIKQPSEIMQLLTTIIRSKIVKLVQNSEFAFHLLRYFGGSNVAAMLQGNASGNITNATGAIPIAISIPNSFPLKKFANYAAKHYNKCTKLYNQNNIKR